MDCFSSYLKKDPQFKNISMSWKSSSEINFSFTLLWRRYSLPTYNSYPIFNVTYIHVFPLMLCMEFRIVSKERDKHFPFVMFICNIILIQKRDIALCGKIFVELHYICNIPPDLFFGQLNNIFSPKSRQKHVWEK